MKIMANSCAIKINDYKITIYDIYCYYMLKKYCEDTSVANEEVAMLIPEFELENGLYSISPTLRIRI